MARLQSGIIRSTSNWALPVGSSIAYLDELTLTHRLIADMLGVRREGVTEAAGKLQSVGVIQYCHGHITVLTARLRAALRVLSGSQDGIRSPASEWSPGGPMRESAL